MGQESTKPTVGITDLTRREAEVMALRFEGLTSQEIADKLCVSKRTVDFHIRNVYKALDVRNLAQAMNKLRA